MLNFLFLGGGGSWTNFFSWVSNCPNSKFGGWWAEGCWLNFCSRVQNCSNPKFRFEGNVDGRWWCRPYSQFLCHPEVLSSNMVPLAELDGTIITQNLSHVCYVQNCLHQAPTGPLKRGYEKELHVGSVCVSVQGLVIYAFWWMLKRLKCVLWSDLFQAK